jgi:hypothetical protein
LQVCNLTVDYCRGTIDHSLQSESVWKHRKSSWGQAIHSADAVMVLYKAETMVKDSIQVDAEYSKKVLPAPPYMRSRMKESLQLLRLSRVFFQTSAIHVDLPTLCWILMKQTGNGETRVCFNVSAKVSGLYCWPSSYAE